MKQFQTACGVSFVLPPDRLTLRIQKWPQASILKEPSTRVTDFWRQTEEFKDIITEMIYRMYCMGGIGLAANQVGIRDRLFVMDTEYTKGKEQCPLVCLNPIILSLGDSTVSSEEGCLSCDDVKITKQRHEELQLQYTDLAGEDHVKAFFGLAAICIQHEVDHLEGKLIIDDVSPLRLDVAKRKGKKARRVRTKSHQR